MSYHNLRQKVYQCLIDLSHEDGINASGKHEVFGCIFGRDSFITILKLLHVVSKKNDPQLIDICHRSLVKHLQLQGREINIESGEQPGKFIHEYRTDNYERLTKRVKPWYVYPDKILRNYDSIDSTPLGLIAIYRYWQVTGDNRFLLQALPSVELALNWIITYGDMDKDFLIEYELPEIRKHGGLVVQSWTDSVQSISDVHGNLPPYPIAPVEVQGITWLALKLWADYYSSNYAEQHSSRFGHKLESQAKQMKEQFNKTFLLKSKGKSYFAQALDGYKRQIKTITSHPLICLWAAYSSDETPESIIDNEYLEEVVQRGFQADMFVSHAGIRTMSSESPTFNATDSAYHTGSFWPMLNGLIMEGLENFGFTTEVKMLRSGMLQPLKYFASPIEVYIENRGSYLPYRNPQTGQISCYNQAWSAAAALDVLDTSL